ncbi:BTB/POZ and MATH domain-containing protein 3 [Hibiscus syriacus]|uniref:BTB/POZ and MATH domain-containing protein 3 n=1 Tax=Hibiscus syriacus TaxID=106335 RepID=A0A6A2X957_HIBSY|nr:BTB/POZ and MATH domain-containing protein 3 [Hibiscus syriacus]
MDDSEGTVSKSVNETVNGSHQFTIKGYSLAKGMGPGKCIAGDIFTVGGYDWAVCFYPDGKNPEDTAMYVSVFIALASEGTDVRALFELTLVDQSGKGKHKVHSHFDRALESGPYALKYRGSMWGYKRFFRRTTLEASDYIKDDCIIMNCTVVVVRTRIEGLKQCSIHVPPSDMGQNLKALLESEIGCDLIFQFFGLVGDPNMDKVVVKDVEPSVFKAVLLFIYTDKLSDIQEITGPLTTCMSTNMMQHILSAADLYNLDRLKVLCEAKLSEELNADTVATTLALAEQYRCAQLKAVCLKFAATSANLGEEMQSEGFRHLEESCPTLLSELLKASASVEECSSLPSRKKRSGSSLYGMDLAAEAPMEEPKNPNERRVRR